MLNLSLGNFHLARAVQTPTVAKFADEDGVQWFCVIGTDYGRLRDIHGAARLWKSASGAYRAARAYRAIRSA